jgi:RNA polymerase sigma factor (sigma-70 family)
MVDDDVLEEWFRNEVLPLERAITNYIRRNWRMTADVTDLRQEIYERALIGARSELPRHTERYLRVIARNHLINRARREKVISFELVGDMTTVNYELDVFATERHLSARDELRRAEAGLNRLPPRCREVVRLRKVEGLSTKEAAERLGISTDTVEKQLTQGMRALVDFMLGGTGKIRRPPKVRRRHWSNSK